ncbi:hypothetical protein [Cellvibrio polysaccharolyticus]|uniref:hypothetical protein n=1 Tax=Cellvibrio polysaccharolyticus TaxID=2082724 RepID=UPI00188269DD|nr:hypothetical protein [Cellvibrio polysaccharolyticus]
MLNRGHYFSGFFAVDDNFSTAIQGLRSPLRIDTARASAYDSRLFEPQKKYAVPATDGTSELVIFRHANLSYQAVSNDVNDFFVQCVQQYRTAGRRSFGGDVVKAVETTGINL